jgi:hypothetical protein
MRLERGEKQGKWEGEAPAEPKWQRMATGDWRLANGFCPPTRGGCLKVQSRLKPAI